MMVTVTLKEVAAKLSERLVKWSPVYAKVTKVINKRTFELKKSDEAATPSTFFEDDSRNWILNPSEKERVFWQYHRSFHCETYVHAFALALKMLNDSGITFVHEDSPVIDFRVMYLQDFDISDIIEARELNLIDPSRGVTVSSFCTHKNLKFLQTIDTNACQLLCRGIPQPGRPGVVDPYYYEFCEKSFAPHWWIAAVVDSTRLGSTQRCLFHVDICGAAHDDRAFQEYHGSLLSLWTFTTPDYELMPTVNIPRGMRMTEHDDKFIMTPYTRATHLRGRPFFPVLQPYWLRHMRSYYFSDASAIIVSTLQRYLSQSRNVILHSLDEWMKIVHKLRDNFVLRVSPFTQVTIEDHDEIPELNGQRGTVISFSHGLGEDRLIPVRVHAISKTIKLSPKFVRPDSKRQYLDYEELRRIVGDHSPYESMLVPMMAPEFEVSHFRKELHKNTGMRRVYAALCLRKITYRFLLDSFFKKGIKRFQDTAFDLILQPWQAEFIKRCLEIDNPKGREALHSIRDRDLDRETGKPMDGQMLTNGMVEQREWGVYYRSLDHLLSKIGNDNELEEAFMIIKEARLFCDIREHLNVLKLFEYGLDVNAQHEKK